MAKTPLTVYKSNGSWSVRVGKHGEIVYGDVERKSDAITVAKHAMGRQSALAGQTHRTGVVVLTADGEYQRFIPNEKYMRRFQDAART